MQIYIDESGPFVVPTTGHSSVCCVSALVIPDADYAEIARNFEAIKTEWGIQGKEPKGRELDEYQISAVIQMLGRYEVIFQTVAIDMGSQTETGIEQHKQLQADKITENITPE